MTTPQATTSTSTLHDGLSALFINWANNSFDKSIDSWNEQAFYQHVMTKLEANVDLRVDLPELENLKPHAAKSIVKRMKKAADVSVDAAWELKPAVAKLFRTTIRSSYDEQSLLPCFDVEYKALTDSGTVSVEVKTWRRNVKVVLIGHKAAIDSLYGQIVTASLTGNY